MRILLVVPTLMPGGTERQIYLLAKGLASGNRHYVEVVSLYKKGDVERDLQIAGLKYKCIGMRAIYDVWGAIRLAHFIKNGKFDIVHNFLLDANFWGAIAAFFAGVKAIIGSRRDTDVWKKTRHVTLERVGNIFAKKIVVNAKAIKDYIARQEGLSPERIEVIYNGIETDAFRASDKPYHKMELLGPKDEMKVVTMIGTLSVKKSQESFLKAVCRIINDYNKMDVKFLIVGRGPLEAYLKKVAQDWNVKDYVEFLGFRRDVPNILAATDVFVLTSQFEGLPNSILEAMACKLPVVATRVGGVPEAVEDGQSGLLVEPNNQLAMAETITRLLEDELLRSSMGQRGREIVEERFSLNRMVRDYENLYETLLERSKEVRT